jgi:hypothetical protein
MKKSGERNVAETFSNEKQEKDEERRQNYELGNGR